MYSLFFSLKMFDSHFQVVYDAFIKRNGGGLPMAEYEGQPMNVTEAAAYLRVSRNTILALFKSGELRGRKIGREWRCLKEDLDSLVREGIGTESKRRSKK